MNTLINALSIVQLACVGVLAWIAVTAINEREKERKRAERRHAIGHTMFTAACMYMEDRGIPQPDIVELAPYLARVIDEPQEENDQPE